MAETPYLVDSNVLLRWVKPDHSDYLAIASATDAILRRDGVLCYTSQNVAPGEAFRGKTPFAPGQPCRSRTVAQTSGNS